MTQIKPIFVLWRICLVFLHRISIASAKETEAYKSAEAEQADTPLMKLLSEDISPNVKNISDIIGQIRDMLSREIGGFTL